MELTEKLSALDAAFVEGRIEEVANEHTDKSAVAHIQNLITLRGKSAIANLHNFRSGLHEEATIEVVAQRAIPSDNATVSLYAVDASAGEGRRFKSLFLLARRFNDRGKVVEEEILPIGSTADAQAYFPDTRLPPKQVQPRLSFVSATRKRRAGGKPAGRPPRAVRETDIHRLRMVGPKVLANMKNAGIETFQHLSEASDELLQKIRDESGRKLRNFNFAYWRDAALMALQGDFDKIPNPPSAKKQVVGKRDAKVDFSQLRDDDINYLPKVGPRLLEAFHDANIHTFSDLAHASDDTLEALREPAGRPFVNFDMTYFRTAARKKLDGAKTIPAPPPVTKPKAAGKVGAGGRSGRKPRPTNPNDIHELPGVGAQLVAALHEEGIYTFTDLATAPLEALRTARAKTKGKYKNIDLAYLKRQARYAEAGQFEKFELPVKIDKSEEVAGKSDPVARFQARLRSANENSIGLLPSLGPGIKQELANRGIRTMTQLANADDAVLSEVVRNSGRRFSKFDVTFWKRAAADFLAGNFDKIPNRAPVAEKKAKTGGKRGPRATGNSRGRTPRNESDLGALPSVGTTVAHELRAAGLDTFAKLAKASDDQLRAVRANAGPKFKSFDVSYWRTVAELALKGEHNYPAPPRAEGKAKVKAERKARERKPVNPNKLGKLSNVGPGLAKALRDNSINTWHDIVDAENWLLLKAFSEAGKRTRSLDPEDLKRAAKDALNGKFPERQTRSKKEPLPEGHSDFTALPGLGKGVQEKLYDVGVRSYADLAKANIGLLEEVRDQVRGRVAKSNVRDWKELGRLANAGEWHKVDPSKYAEDERASAKTTPGKPKVETGKDDLRRIKGIGPQAVQIFQSRGVKTFIQVAALSDDALAAILEEGGPRTRSLSPASVRDQAAELAAEAHGSITSSAPDRQKEKAGKADKSAKADKAGKTAKADKDGKAGKVSAKAKTKTKSK